MLYIYILNLKIWEDVIIEKSFKMFEQGTYTHTKMTSLILLQKIVQYD